ncbi:hypothetical protein A0J48_008835 [Sphaerospermopsis aphanizomenoides BCCUSP55]|uniref:hypothetical protein n=1 Tax=Sphaerospermopsis aphanizomenoides TaxID=459663 RepID=UPI001907D8F7|nr:hypothetical protein [Sphaerospermopsis aphanizomenoides]MBK1987641.1 hypothetical protein [Sphaerospermopsis aphanizomenoides BCCUSP55]
MEKRRSIGVISYADDFVLAAIFISELEPQRGSKKTFISGFTDLIVSLLRRGYHYPESE